MTDRALMAIVGARLRAERRTIVYACAAALLVGALHPIGLAGPLFFCSLLGIVTALVQSPGRHPHLDLCEESAPLFGRELARAKAVTPAIVAALATIAYCATAAIYDYSGAARDFVFALPAVEASTLTALCATIRIGSSRLLYVAMACAIAAVAYALAQRAAIAEPIFCALVAFFALRQYGEALARYDPVS
ncbi:MAG TPA: hypothetical protein VNG31_06635 [Candidatus Baltobacteraceae bacterium]|nr:hypothetical protein [Candidatus Baltobacteraceae bacterium]